MIPLFVCDDESPVCLVGLAWNPVMLAEFMAWWMPLNLLSWLSLLLFVAIREGEIGKKAATLPWCLLMTFGFWPIVAKIAAEHYVGAFLRYYQRRTHRP